MSDFVTVVDVEVVATSFRPVECVWMMGSVTPLGQVPLMLVSERGRDGTTSKALLKTNTYLESCMK